MVLNVLFYRCFSFTLRNCSLFCFFKSINRMIMKICWLFMLTLFIVSCILIPSKKFVSLSCFSVFSQLLSYRAFQISDISWVENCCAHILRIIISFHMIRLRCIFVFLISFGIQRLFSHFFKCFVN